MSEESFSLLSQKEIDTLIRFLSQKDNQIARDVLSQDSIDKLIHLIESNDVNKVRVNTVESVNLHAKADILLKLHLKENPSQPCELRYTIDSETQYLHLYAHNMETEEEIEITPLTLNPNDPDNAKSGWGYCMAPIMFDTVASILRTKFTRETFDGICALFARLNFGSSTTPLASIYFPNSEQLLDKLIE